MTWDTCWKFSIFAFLIFICVGLLHLVRAVEDLAPPETEVYIHCSLNNCIITEDLEELPGG